MNISSGISKPAIIVHKSISNQCIAELYIDGKSICIMAGVGEGNIQQRKGWIERKLRETGDYSEQNIIECIKMSKLWLNYLSYGAKYSVVNEETYCEWDKRSKNKIKPFPQPLNNNI